jgi:hypothetical protein
MSFIKDATTMPDQGASNNSVVQLAASELPTNPSTNDAVVFVADGEWEDPRQAQFLDVVRNAVCNRVFLTNGQERLLLTLDGGAVLDLFTRKNRK